MTDEILKKIDEKIEYQRKIIDAYGVEGLDIMPELRALREAIEYISDIPDWHVLMTMPPKSPKNIKLKEIAAILGVKGSE